MGRKLKYPIDMDKVTQAANDLVAIKGTTIISNKEIRKHCYTYGLDDYSIWRTFLVKANRTDAKAVYDISSLVDATKAISSTKVTVVNDDEVAEETKLNIDSWIESEEPEDDYEDEDLNEAKTNKDFESEFYEDVEYFDAMDFIGDAYREYVSSVDITQMD